MESTIGRLARLVKIGSLGAGAIALIRWLRGSRPSPATGSASWPPLVETPPNPQRRDAAASTDAATESRTEHDESSGSVDPVDGMCPVTHPVKGNADSGIYHVPGGAFYERTVPERCFLSAEAAEAEGFRRAKR